MSHALSAWLPGDSEAGSHGLFEEEDLSVPRGHREKPWGLSIIYCKRWRRQQTRGQTTPSRPSLCLPKWAAGQVHWTGEGRRVHKARAQLV